ncbi:hypothetical protein AB4455_17390 [Vibrio sp. 10N.261.46.E12]|uniref:hypothetical protein n=2 Tax=Vibrio TaxID=662 RepID=UPI000976CA88|nr:MULTISPECIES: hypothetical protein [unclassified Vibrio]OMO36363.1 hypothetical protein BH584_26035 [Vibrio sp. 10N.261.45.E1]PMJ25750.1 hypothetical protein BCU27_10290 [Vibrio sp. 10N.286.45.B6]PML84689.1 hypothetical protein BCT66_16915 [Vibrio sp. 10N.261.49.E11]PMM76247.1 hypothetical protein BCT48_25225 [Vibrio sp. 10N.261.46.F12]PMM83438.1 hypothetical protein BCT46_12750 [Vibrio sp. 10N.261.46.E8]
MYSNLQEVTNTLLYAQQNQKINNRLFDDNFVINNKSYDVSFKDSKFSPESKIFIRHAIVIICGGYKEDNKLNIPHADLHKKVINFFNFIKYLKYIEVQNIVEDVNYNTLLDYLEHTLKESYKSGKILSFSSFIRLSDPLNALSDATIRGDFLWITTMKARSRNFEDIAKKFFMENGLESDFNDYLWGGSLETVSYITSTYILSFCIEQVDSINHKLLAAYFETCRHFNTCSWYRSDKRTPNNIKFFHEAETYDVETLKMNFDELVTYTKSLKTNSKRFKFWHDSFNEKLDKGTPKYSIRNFFKLIKNKNSSLGTSKELSKRAAFYNNCALSIVAIVTGLRSHELVNMKAINVLKEKKKEIWIVTDINKTHQGFSYERTTGTLVNDAIDSLLNISFLDKTKEVSFIVDDIEYSGYPSLFYNGAVFKAGKLQTKRYKLHHRPTGIWLESGTDYIDDDTSLVSKRGQQLNKRFNSIYEEMLKSLPIDIREELKKREKSERLTIHGCRHLWADYLMRRFDGDIHRALRRHLAHSSSDVLNFTHAYKRNKVTSIEQHRAETHYSIELVKRIAGDVNHTKYSGHTVAYVRNYIEGLNWKTPDELDEMIEAWIQDEDDGIERLVPHSYGFCMVFKSRRKLANCIDKQGVPKIENGESGVCIGCPNLSVHCDSHLLTLEQLMITHQNILHSMDKPEQLVKLLRNSNNKRYKHSERQIKVIETLIKPLESSH